MKIKKEYFGLLIVIGLLLFGAFIDYFSKEIQSGLILKSPFEKVEARLVDGNIAIPVSSISLGPVQNSMTGKVHLHFLHPVRIFDNGDLDIITKEGDYVEWAVDRDNMESIGSDISFIGCVDPSNGRGDGSYSSPLLVNTSHSSSSDIRIDTNDMGYPSDGSSDFSVKDIGLTIRPKSIVQWKLDDTCRTGGKVTGIEFENRNDLKFHLGGKIYRSNGMRVYAHMDEVAEDPTLFLLRVQDVKFSIGGDLRGKITGNISYFKGLTSGVGSMEYIEDGMQRNYKLISNYIEIESVGKHRSGVELENKLEIASYKDGYDISLTSKAISIILDGWPLRTSPSRWIKENWILALWYLIGLITSPFLKKIDLSEVSS